MIQVLERFDRILQYVASRNGTSCRIRELSARIGTSQSACSNIVASMVRLGYLEAGPDGGYVLGPAPSLLIRSGTYKEWITKAGAPFLEKLVERINENCLLMTQSGGKRVVLLLRKSSHELQLNEPMMTENLMLTATGTVMLAHFSEAELTRYERVQPFEGCIFPDVSDWKEFREKLPEVRRQGVAQDQRGSGMESRQALAVPVYQRGGLACVLGCWYPLFRASKAEQRNTILRECRRTARELSDALTEQERHP